jgi:hypothetical protein
MSTDSDNPNFLFDAYSHAERLLDAGTAEQSIIFTLTGRGVKHETAIQIVEDLKGPRLQRPSRVRTRNDIAAARHLAKETMLFGILNLAVGLGIALLVLTFVGRSDILYFVGLVFAGWRSVAGGGQLFNGAVDYAMGWEPLPRPNIDQVHMLMRRRRN